MLFYAVIAMHLAQMQFMQKLLFHCDSINKNTEIRKKANYNDYARVISESRIRILLSKSYL